MDASDLLNLLYLQPTFGSLEEESLPRARIKLFDERAPADALEARLRLLVADGEMTAKLAKDFGSDIPRWLAFLSFLSLLAIPATKAASGRPSQVCGSR
jgi:hypothetical protein